MRIQSALFSLAILAAAGCNATRSDVQSAGTANLPPAQPTSAKADRRDIIGYALFPGTVDIPADAVAQVHPTYRAQVGKLDVHIGERVGRGQTLIELALPDQKGAYQQAQADLRAAQTAYASAQAQYGGAVRDAQRQLDEARSAEKAARTSAADSGDGTALQQATQSRQTAEEGLLQARAALKSQLLPYQQQLDSANAAVRDTRSGYRQALIKAPISGTVVDLKAQPGQEIGQDVREVVAQIVNYPAVTIKAIVDSARRELVSRGSHVVFAVADRSKPLIDGTVRSTRDVPSVNGGPAQLEATIDFKNGDVMLVPGTTLRWVGVRTGQVKDVVAVPVDAVQHDPSGKPIVKVLEGSDWKDRVVETGASDGDWIEVKTGVKEGETVQVLPPAHSMRS